ncbi:MAG: hypothetical protein O3C40_31725 [Planctomycetota bacterium]|nr:hypothetical protein [Planctomycetota bacterium]
MRLKLHCSRLGSGLYCLHDLPMINATVKGADRRDLYPSPGEPIGVGGLCPDGVARLFDGMRIRQLESRVVYLTGEVAAHADQADTGGVLMIE